MSFLQKSIEDGSLVFWHDYRDFNGTFDDLSGNGNDGTPSNVEFRGGGVQIQDTTGVITVSDAPSLQFTSFSFVILGVFNKLETGTRRWFFSKEDGGGTQFDVRMRDTPNIGVHDGTSEQTIDIDYRGHTCIAGTCGSGEAWSLYFEGIYQGVAGGASTFTTDDADLLLLNRDNLDLPARNVVWALLLFNRKLTELEHSALYGELMNIQRA